MKDTRFWVRAGSLALAALMAVSFLAGIVWQLLAL